MAQGTGPQKLFALWKAFPRPAATRHWFKNVIIEPEGEGARMSAYVIAMNIKNSPAIIVRTGTYRDALVKINGTWKFQQRVLTLDPASHV